MSVTRCACGRRWDRNANRCGRLAGTSHGNHGAPAKSLPPTGRDSFPSVSCATIGPRGGCDGCWLFCLSRDRRRYSKPKDSTCWEAPTLARRGSPFWCLRVPDPGRLETPSRRAAPLGIPCCSLDLAPCPCIVAFIVEHGSTKIISKCVQRHNRNLWRLLCAQVWGYGKC